MLTWNATIHYIDMQKNFIWLSTGKSLYYISTQPFSSTYKHYYKIISQGNWKIVAYTPCLKCHDHSKLTGLRRMYVGIGPLVCINNLLITPVGNVLMRLGCQGIKGLRIFVGSDFFSNLEIIWSWKPYLCPVTHSYSDILVLRKIQYFITKNLMHRLCKKLWFWPYFYSQYHSLHTVKC